MPSVLQLFSNQTVQASQASPTRRSPPLPVGQVQRGLPTPPHPNVPMPEQQQDHSPSPPQMVNTHYPRPVNRHLSSQFLASFQGVDDNLHMTDELLADIERADMQRTQGLVYAGPYALGYVPPSKEDPVVDRVRKSSPKDADGRRQQQHRAQSRDRQPSSPLNQSQHSSSHTPERRASPNFHTPLGSPGESYVSHSAKSPLSLSLPTQSPPLHTASTTVRTPDKSLPVQEEPEDDHVQVRSRNDWPPSQNESDRRSSSPTPSSDLHPEGNQRSYRDETIRGLQNGRNSRAGHRTEDDDTLIEQGMSVQEEEGHTPRSPTTGLPDVLSDRYSQNRTAAPVNARGRSRIGVTDQLGMRGFDPGLLEKAAQSQERDQPPQYVESRSKPSPQQHLPPRDSRGAVNHAAARYYGFPEELMGDPTSAYLHALLGASPRPDAPIPPTPHSQTSAPSPAPASYDPRHELPPFSPVAPVGSPYPYPFTHVRRNLYSSARPQGTESYENVDLNHPSVISEQMKRQYQIYAQNNLGGHISDSTFSPASTPFPPNYFNQWANWHTHRILGGGAMGNVVRDPMSIRSSPSHEPISLPAPPSVGLKKKDAKANLRRANSIGTRKPPPRVDSTQPRETSPEPSSSGESTAGGEDITSHQRQFALGGEDMTSHQRQFALPEEGNWVNGSVIPTRILRDDDLGDWVDEDDEGDEEDLLELEFHPSYVGNVEKRRRRWETKWEALIQAVSQRLLVAGLLIDFLGDAVSSS